MQTDRKVIVLVLVTAFVVAMNLFMTEESPPILRYVVSIAGEIVIILLAVSLGLDRVRSFTFGSTLGKSLLLISLGLLSWAMGNVIWLYYNVASQVEVPYPSLADAGFLGLIPLMAAGLVLLLSGIQITRDAGTYLKISLIPLAVFGLTFWFILASRLLDVALPMQRILDVIYPLGDALFLSLSLVILSLIPGRKLFRPMGILCLGFVFLAIADFSFSWTTAAGTYYSASWVDAFFALSFFTLGLGMHATRELEPEPGSGR